MNVNEKDAILTLSARVAQAEGSISALGATVANQGGRLGDLEVAVGKLPAELEVVFMKGIHEHTKECPVQQAMPKIIAQLGRIEGRLDGAKQKRHTFSISPTTLKILIPVLFAILSALGLIKAVPAMSDQASDSSGK